MYMGNPNLNLLTATGTATAAISNITVDTNAVTQYGVKERVSGEGRKEEEKVHTMFEDMKEEVSGEEETGGEVEAKKVLLKPQVYTGSPR